MSVVLCAAAVLIVSFQNCGQDQAIYSQTQASADATEDHGQPVPENPNLCDGQSELLHPMVFNSGFYKTRNPQLSAATSKDVVDDWCRRGVALGLQASKYFSARDYLKMYPPANLNEKPAVLNVNAVKSFVQFGRFNNRLGTVTDTNVFDAEFYKKKAALSPNLSAIDTETHYRDIGLPQNIQAHPYFLAGDYADLYPSVKTSTGGSPEKLIANYVTYGLGLGRAGIKTPPAASATTVTVLSHTTEDLFDGDKQACADVDYSDMSPRAFVTDGGNFQLLAGIWDMYTMTGPTLESLNRVCDKPALKSLMLADYNLHRAHDWLQATYTRDGKNVVAISAVDWHGNSVGPDGKVFSDKPECSNLILGGNRCWWGVLTLFESKDSGFSYDTVTDNPVDYRLAAPEGDANINPVNANRIGFFGISNIIKNPQDGAYYFFARVVGREEDAGVAGKQQNANCLFRAAPDANLANPKLWKAYNGTAFTVDTSAREPCAHIAVPGNDIRNITYNTFLKKFVIVYGGTYLMYPYGNRGGIDIRYVTSEKLTEWPATADGTLIQATALPDKVSALYPALIDPSYTFLGNPLSDVRERRNFDLSGREPYLYYTTHKWGEPTYPLRRVKIQFTRKN